MTNQTTRRFSAFFDDPSDIFSAYDRQAQKEADAGEGPEELYDAISVNEAFKTEVVDIPERDTVRIGIGAMSEMTHTTLYPSAVARALREMEREDGNDNLRDALIWVEGGDLWIRFYPGAYALADCSGNDEWGAPVLDEDCLEGIFLGWAQEATERAIREYDDGYHIPAQIAALMSPEEGDEDEPEYA